uniref:BTB domain-containing protein n=1 Tax=Oryza sativa subsp. indica TaxID=39946 RepID=A0A679BAR0_ORYSI|nr:hypothetical protein [Oryza sativa Indica Group]BBD82494.1 hypothetical protein [Oryza sativa Indica Group]
MARDPTGYGGRVPLVYTLDPPLHALVLLGMRKRELQLYIFQVDDMDPSVFRTMLQFIYTDILPYNDEDDMTGTNGSESARRGP